MYRVNKNQLLKKKKKKKKKKYIYIYKLLLLNKFYIIHTCFMYILYNSYFLI